ncbi:MAG: FMN-binding protein [Spirochaetaceae bacterium]
MLKVSLKYGGILFITAVICAFCVSAVFVIVEPIIIERTMDKVRENLNYIFSGTSFEYKDVSGEFNALDIKNADALYNVSLENGTTNYVYEMSPEGRNDEILFLIAYDKDGNVVKIQYVQMRETRGRGDKITKDNYLDKIYNQNASDMDVDMITGATYSSGAMKQSIEDSSNHLISEVLK